MAKKKVNAAEVRRQMELARKGNRNAQSLVARMANDPDHPNQKEANEVTEEVTSRAAQEAIDKLKDS